METGLRTGCPNVDIPTRMWPPPNPSSMVDAYGSSSTQSEATVPAPLCQGRKRPLAARDNEPMTLSHSKQPRPLRHLSGDNSCINQRPQPVSDLIPSWSLILEPYIRQYATTFLGGWLNREDSGMFAEVKVALDSVAHAMHYKDPEQGESAVRYLVKVVSQLRDSQTMSHGTILTPNLPPIPALGSPTTTSHLPAETQGRGQTTIPSFPTLVSESFNSQAPPSDPVLQVPDPRQGQKACKSEPLEASKDLLVQFGTSRKVRQRKTKTYSQPSPSKHCHICARVSGFVELVVCHNINNGTCRKTTCDKCFMEFGWDWVDASSPQSRWTCTHCDGNCPDRAQCVIYRRTNGRRRLAASV